MKVEDLEEEFVVFLWLAFSELRKVRHKGGEVLLPWYWVFMVKVIGYQLSRCWSGLCSRLRCGSED